MRRLVQVALPLIVTLAAGANAAPAQIDFTVSPLRDVEPTGEPWYYPVCPIGECPPIVGAYVRQLTRFGDLVALSAFDFEHGEELWVSDGTPAGTRRVADLCPGPCFAMPGITGPLGGELIFSAEDATGQRRLAATDGAAVRWLGDRYGSPAVEVGGWLHFAYFHEVWATDGTVVEQTSDFPPGEFHPVAQLFRLGSLPFAWRDGFFSAPHELWTVQIPGQEIVRTCQGGFSRFAVLGDRAFFAAGCVEGEPDLGPGLFHTDGSPGGTERVLTFEGSPGFDLLAADGSMFFVERAAPDYDADARLWRSDGTAGGSAPLTGYLPGPIRPLLFLGHRYLVIAGETAVRSLDLESGAVTTLPAPGTASLVDRPTAYAAPSGAFGVLAFGHDGLWITDGTAAGTVEAFSDGQSAAFLDEHRVVFAVDGAVSPEELWLLEIRGRQAVEIPTLGVVGALAFALLLGWAAVRLLRR